MKKLISFRQLKNNCTWYIVQNKGHLDCGYYCGDDRISCTAKNCPVWKKLEIPLDRWWKNLWAQYENYKELCEKCIHNDYTDQICDHTGWDKRTVKKCGYRREAK